MLRKIQITFSLITIITLAGWWILRKPYSLSDELQRVYYPAFEVTGIDAGFGKQLAQTVSKWEGIAAAAYNPHSALLSVACVEGTNEDELIRNLEKSAGAPVLKKVFHKPDGPKCPIPAEIIKYIPLYLLWISYLAFILSIFSFFPYLLKRFTTYEKYV